MCHTWLINLIKLISVSFGGKRTLCQLVLEKSGRCFQDKIYELQRDPVTKKLLYILHPSNSTSFVDYVMSVFLQVESDLDSKLPLLDVVNSSFPSWAARNLSAVLLPPLPPVVPPPSSRSRTRARATPLNKPAPAVKKGPKRPSLR